MNNNMSESRTIWKNFEVGADNSLVVASQQPGNENYVKQRWLNQAAPLSFDDRAKALHNTAKYKPQYSMNQDCRVVNPLNKNIEYSKMFRSRLVVGNSPSKDTFQATYQKDSEEERKMSCNQYYMGRSDKPLQCIKSEHSSITYSKKRCHGVRRWFQTIANKVFA